MGRMIRKGSAAERILRDVRLTLKSAELRGSPLAEDAVDFLGEVVASADEIRALEQAARTELDDARLAQATLDHDANDWVAEIKDELFNAIGRTARDRVFLQIFPGGSTRYTSVRPAAKGSALEHLASLLESLPHPRIQRDRVAELATELRERAAQLKELAGRVQDAQTTARLTSSRLTAVARYGRIQLSLLKRHWLARGLSETDVHKLIPHRPVAPAEERAPDEAASTALVAQAEPPDDDALDEADDWDEDEVLVQS